MRMYVEKWPLAFGRFHLERFPKSVSSVARNDVKVEVEDRLEGHLAVTHEKVDSLAAQA